MRPQEDVPMRDVRTILERSVDGAVDAHQGAPISWYAEG